MQKFYNIDGPKIDHFYLLFYDRTEIAGNLKSNTKERDTALVTTTSVTRLGDLLGFGQLFKAFGNN